MIYYCPNCHQYWGGEDQGNVLLCSDCNTRLVSTGIEKQQWDNMSKEQKDAVKQKMKDTPIDKTEQTGSPTNVSTFKKDAEMISLVENVKMLTHDVHIMYIVMIVLIVVQIILGLCIGAAFSRY